MISNSRQHIPNVDFLPSLQAGGVISCLYGAINNDQSGRCQTILRVFEDNPFLTTDYCKRVPTSSWYCLFIFALMLEMNTAGIQSSMPGLISVYRRTGHRRTPSLYHRLSHFQLSLPLFFFVLLFTPPRIPVVGYVVHGVSC